MTPEEGGSGSAGLKELHKSMKSLHAKFSRSATFQSTLLAYQLRVGYSHPAKLQPAAETRMTGNVDSYKRVLRNGLALKLLREDDATAADVRSLIPSDADLTSLAELTSIMSVVCDIIILVQSESFLTKAAEYPLILRATQLLRPDGLLQVVKWDDSSNLSVSSDSGLLATSVKFSAMSPLAQVARTRGEQDLLRRFPRPDAVQFVAMRLSPIFCNFDFVGGEVKREAWIEEANAAVREEYTAVAAARRKALGLPEAPQEEPETTQSPSAPVSLPGMSAPPAKARKVVTVAQATR